MNRFHPLRVESARPETRDAVVLTLAVPPELAAQYRYAAGQHLNVRATINGKEVRRSYSICASQPEQRLRIAVKRVPGGAFSNWAIEQLREGATLEAMPPDGHFGLPFGSADRRRYLAVAAGSGITPVLSVIRTALQTEPAAEVTLVYGNRSSATVMFRDEIAELKDLYPSRFSVVHVLSREQQDVDLFNGRIDRERCRELFSRWIDVRAIDAAFVCGPLPMMEAVAAELEAAGVERSRIRMEVFATSIPKGPRHVAHPVVGRDECEVTVVHDGRTRSFSMSKNDLSVLDAALEQGIELPYSCKAGVCSTCRCKLVDGDVDMDTNYALEDYEIARGARLSCQSYPVSDRLVIDFDQET